MRRFRNMRRRKAALALLPAAALATIGIGTGIATGAEAAKFDANKAKVKPGSKVKLVGEFDAAPATLAAAGEKSREVQIQFRAAGTDRWRNTKSTEHDKSGRYVQRVKVRRSGFYRAVHADGRTSKREKIRVKAQLRAKVSKKNVNLGDKVKIKGKVKPTISRRKVTVKVGGDKIKTKTNAKGKFKVKWNADETGRVTAKAKAKGDKVAAGDKDKAGRITVYRPAEASWYGPGFYGNRTACGQRLSRKTVGVAHKRLPCGTKVTVKYKGRFLRTRVIDRGPYAHGASWDLTSRAAKKLRFETTDTIRAAAVK
jgi:rare lipoprotein A (peptidoglycan hydrolase)